MEIVYIPRFVTGKENSSVFNRLQLLGLLANRLASSRVAEPDLTVPVMKILAYLKPLPDVSYLNELQDQLKELVFHLHLRNGKTEKTASLDLSEANKDFFPKDMSQNLNKLFHLQSLLKKEHRSCVKMFEKYALDLHRQGNRDYVRKIVDEKRSSLLDREEILRSQLETLSIQMAIMIEKHITQLVRSLRFDLKRRANSSGAPSEISDTLQAIRPDRVSHQIYLEACDTYEYPSRPQSLVYCQHCKGAVPACPTTGECVKNDYTVPDNIFNSNVSAYTDREASSKSQYYTARKAYRPIGGRGFKINKGDSVKTKLESSAGDWMFGFKKSALGLKKTWGFFPSSAMTGLRCNHKDCSPYNMFYGL